MPRTGHAFSRTGLQTEYDYFVEVARGNIPGQSTVIIRGHNPDLDIADGFQDVAHDGDLTYLTGAETMNIVSDDANDDAGDTGLRTLLINGVDGGGNFVSEIITLNGTSDVETVKTYLRVNAMIGLTVGSSGWNEGEVTATSTVTASIQAHMGATESLSQNSNYTVPLGQSFLLLKVELNAAKISGGGNPELEFKGYARPGGDGAAWLQLFDKRLDTAVTDELDVDVSFPFAAPQRTDIRMRADTDINNTECRTRMYGLLIDN